MQSFFSISTSYFHLEAGIRDVRPEDVSRRLSEGTTMWLMFP